MALVPLTFFVLALLTSDLAMSFAETEKREARSMAEIMR